jgi:3-hydroxybutyryl-CoA dehydrogenase
MEIKKIAVFGTGLMGKGIIHVLAKKGFLISVYSKSQTFQQRMEDYLQHEVSKARLEKKDVPVILSNIKFCSYAILEEMEPVDLVIETSYEDKEFKQELLQRLSSFCTDHTILTTNTSTYSITELGSVAQKPENVCGMHFFSPVPLMPLVEVVKGLCTSADTVDAVCTLAKMIDKIPVVVNDTPGFVLNRILLPFILEAIRLVEQGVATSENIDTIMMLGMNLKVGPLKLADLIGLDVVKTSLDNLFNEFKETKYQPSILLNNMVRAKMLGKKTGKGFYNYSL